MQKNKAITLKVTVALAMLAAISIILGKYLAIPGGEVLRFSFENLPIIFAGMAFGPLAGALVGAVADLVGCVMVGYTVNPVVTLGAVVIGTVSGITWMLFKKVGCHRAIKTAITVVLAHLIGSVLIKTVGLAVYYEMHIVILMLWRLLNYLIVGILEGVIIHVLIGNKMIEKQIASLKTERGVRRTGDDEK